MIARLDRVVPSFLSSLRGRCALLLLLGTLRFDRPDNRLGR
jgi:hypothetical protein